MARPKSTNIFHFTKSLNTLQSILQTNGFYPQYHLEDTSWLNVLGWSPMAFPMVCFCDIPLSRISVHVKDYGKYGLGMSRSWAIRKGLNPILYISAKAPISESIFQVVRWAGKDARNDQTQDVNDKIYKHTNFILAHIKALSREMSDVDGIIITKEFYQENEWRYVPRVEGIHKVISKTKYDNQEIRTKFNEKLKRQAVLKFEPNDIQYLFVNSEEDVGPLCTFIYTELKEISPAERETLVTRIMKLEDIEKDF